MKFGVHNDVDVERGLRVVAGQIAKDNGITVNFHDGQEVDADIFTKVIRVPRLACSAEIPAMALMLVRAQTYHEAGHLIESIVDKADYEELQGSLFKCWNAIEDRRMENKVGENYPGCRIGFKEKMAYYNKRISKQISEEGIEAPLWEALCAMGMRSVAVTPGWALTEKAQLYFDAGYDIFNKWHDDVYCKDAYGSAKLAKELHDALKEAAKEYEKEEDPEQKPQQGQGGSGSGDSGDLDDDKKGSKSSGSGKNDKGEKGEDKGKDWDNVLDKDSENGLEEKDVLNKDISEMIDKMDKSYDSYIAYREDDYIVVPDQGDVNCQEYRKMHSEGGSVMLLTYSLQQALKAMTKSRKRPYMRQGKVDKKRYVQIAKSLSKEVCYQTRKGMKLDASVFIIIDESASMNRCAEAMKKTVMGLSEAMNGLHVPFSICGSTTKYSSPPRGTKEGFIRSNPIEYRYYKNFNENWMAVGHRIMNIGYGYRNVDGEVIEFAAHSMARRFETRKIIISINDGCPDSGEGNSAIFGNNIIKVCKDVRAARMEVYGFGIGTYGPARYYGEENFIYIEQDGTMGPEMVKNFAAILTGGRILV